MASNFSLTTEQLKGLPFYQQKISQASKANQAASDTLSVEFRCTAVALGMLALLAAGGSAALIVLSHGPFTNLPYFVSGVVVGSASIGFLVGIAIAYAYSSGQKVALQQDAKLQEEANISLQDMLVVLTQAQPQEIAKVLGPLDMAQQGLFIKGTYEQFFGGDNPQLLTSEQKEVVNAFTHCEDALVEQIGASERSFAWNLILTIRPGQLTDSIIEALIGKIGEPTNEAEANWLLVYHEFLSGIPEKSRDFAILKHASPDLNPPVLHQFMRNPSKELEAKNIMRHPASMKMKMGPLTSDDFVIAVLEYAPSDVNRDTLDVLFKNVKLPLSEKKASALARHPKALVCFMESKDGYGWIANYPEVIAGLAHTHPSIFTPEILANIYPKMGSTQKTHFLKQMADTRDQIPEKQKEITDAVRPLFSILITEIVELNGPAENSTERSDLFVQMARWPSQVAESIFATGFTKAQFITNELKLMSMLCNQMDPAQQTIFKETAVQMLLNRNNCVSIYPALIQATTSNDRLGHLIDILGRTPVLMAQAMNKTRAERPDNVIVQKMQGEHLVTYRQKYMEIFKRDNSTDAVKIRLMEELLPSPAPFDQLDASYSLAYFKAFPKDLKEMVIENDKLGTEEQRGLLALRLLELMEEKAEVAIEDLDSGLTTKGYPLYNYLTNQLVKEAQSAGTNISKSRARLMARFSEAQDAGKRIIELTRVNMPIQSTFIYALFGGEDRLLLPPEHKGWAAFHSAANGQISNVYKKS